MDAQAAWSAHLQNAATLRSYASAMHQLATCHWQLPNSSCHTTAAAAAVDSSSCRISWIANVLKAYFHDGGRSKQRSKDAKRLARYRQIRPDIFENSRELQASCDNNDSLVASCDSGKLPASCDSANSVTLLDTARKDSITEADRLQQNDEAIGHPIPVASDREVDLSLCPDLNSLDLLPLLSVLDVGSCFNPFQEFR